MRDKEKVKIYNKKYRLENKEKIKQIQDDYYLKHRTNRIKNARKWALDNPNKALETRQLYMKTPQGRLTSIKGSARTRNIEYHLTDVEALKILTTPCFYCRNKNVGIDRIDSDKGYVIDNCVACCAMCNYMKRTYTRDEFIQQCKIISSFHP